MFVCYLEKIYCECIDDKAENEPPGKDPLYRVICNIDQHSGISHILKKDERIAISMFGIYDIIIKSSCVIRRINYLICSCVTE